MAVMINWFLEMYKYTMEEVADPRADHIFLVASPFPLTAIIAIYLIFVLYLGPKIMQNKQPLNIDKLLLVYNVVQVIANGYMSVVGIMCVWQLHTICELPVYSTSDYYANLNFQVLLFYFLSKISDLLDTIFFVLRKKQRQISFLHVYHHASMVLWSWIGIRFVGGGTTTYVPAVNCFIHVIMYGYYLLTVMNKDLKNSVWWKKHITEVQLIQFLIMISVFGWTILQRSCAYPNFVATLIVKENLFFFVLFADFYYRTYITKKHKY